MSPNVHGGGLFLSIYLRLPELCLGSYQALFIFVPSKFNFLKSKSSRVTLQPLGALHYLGCSPSSGPCLLLPIL